MDGPRRIPRRRRVPRGEGVLGGDDRLDRIPDLAEQGRVALGEHDRLDRARCRSNDNKAAQGHRDGPARSLRSVAALGERDHRRVGRVLPRVARVQSRREARLDAARTGYTGSNARF